MSKPCMHWLSGMTNNSDNCPYCRIAELEAENAILRTKFLEGDKHLLVAQAEVKRKKEALEWVNSRWADVSTLVLVREALSAPSDTSAIDALLMDAKRLDFIEAEHTLHGSLEFLYVVDGYSVQKMYDDAPVGPFHEGETLRAAIDAAIGASHG